MKGFTHITHNYHQSVPFLGPGRFVNIINVIDYIDLHIMRQRVAMNCHAWSEHGFTKRTSNSRQDSL